MPRKIAGGSSSSPFQINSAQSSDRPVTSPPVDQNSTSQAFGPSSSYAEQAQGKGKAARLRLLAKMQETNKLETQEWSRKLSEGAFRPLKFLFQSFGEKLLLLSEEDYRWKNKLEETENEQSHEQCLKEGEPIMEELGKVKSDYEKEWANTSGKAMSVIESFDSLPGATKSRLYTKELEDIVKDAKSAYMTCQWMELCASVTVVSASNQRVEGKSTLLDLKSAALIEEMSDENCHSNRMQSVFEELNAEYSQLSQSSKAYVAEGMKIIEACDKALLHPYLHEGSKSDIKNQSLQALNLISHLHFFALNAVYGKLQMSIEFAIFDRKKKQGDGNLRKWHELTSSVMREECDAILGMSHHLITVEMSEMSEKSTNHLTRKELLVRQEAARDVQNKIEKIIRGGKKRLEEYDHLEEGEKNDGVRPLLRELTEAATEFLRSREYAEQFWVDKTQELKDRNDSFLPSNMRSKSSRQHTDKKTSSLPPSASGSESSKRDDFHRTTEGVVFGRINEQAKLDSLDNKGMVVATYFKDQDNEKWVKDYGDDPESESEQPALSTTSVASGDETVVREQVARFAQKANNIAQASMRFSEKARAEVAASNDYDDKINLLQRAFSEKAKAVAKIKNIEVELNDLRPKDRTGKNLTAALKDYLKRLQAGKNDLDKQLQQAQRALNHHSHKSRDPSGGYFRFLWEEGQVASIVKEFNRQPNRSNANDYLDRYVISFSQGAQGEQYEPWIVHAHYDSAAPGAAPLRVHMKRNAEKDWGVEQQAYHSLPLSKETFNLVKQEAQKQEASPSVKKGNRKRR